MRLHYPLNANGAEDAGQLPWKDGVPSTGVEGSYPGHAIVTDVEAEILAAIDASGQARNGSDLAQLIQAVARGIYVGQFSGSANTLTAAIPNNVVFSALQVGTRITGFVATPNTTGVTLALIGIGTASGTVQAPLLRRDGLALQAGDLPTNQQFEVRWDGSAFRMVGGVASDAASTSAVTLISQALQSNIKTTVFSNATTTNLTNGAATAVVFADNSTPGITNNGAGTFTCYAPGAYLINFNTSIGTVLSSGGSNDVFARILINGVSTGFNKSPYYAPGAATFFQFVSVNLQSAVVRLGTNDTIQMAAGVTVPSGFSSAYSQGHVASFTRLF